MTFCDASPDDRGSSLFALDSFLSGVVGTFPFLLGEIGFKYLGGRGFEICGAKGCSLESSDEVDWSAGSNSTRGCLRVETHCGTES